MYTERRCTHCKGILRPNTLVLMGDDGRIIIGFKCSSCGVYSDSNTFHGNLPGIPLLEQLQTVTKAVERHGKMFKNKFSIVPSKMVANHD